MEKCLRSLFSPFIKKLTENEVLLKLKEWGTSISVDVGVVALSSPPPDLIHNFQVSEEAFKKAKTSP